MTLGPPQRPAREAGFSLIEVLVSTVVLGFIASGVAAAVILFFRTADGTGTRLSLSHDSQLLANYLIPDLDSLTSGKPTLTPPFSPQPCPAAMVPFQKLTLQYADVSTGASSEAGYTVSGAVLTRSFGPAGQPPTSSIPVVHNLKPGSACFTSGSGSPLLTMTITAEANGDPATDYTFSVTGGGRVTTPLPSRPPAFQSAVAKDSNGDGKIDQVVVTFDQPLNVNDAAGISQWQFGGRTPGGAVLSKAPPVVSGSTVTLFLTGATVDTTVDTTSPHNFTVALSPADPNGIRNGANQPSTFGATQVDDGMPAVPISVASRDADGDGIDQVVVTFSEPLGTDPTPTENGAWTLSGLPGATLDSSSPPVIALNAATLHLNEAVPIDTVGPGLQVALAIDPAGVVDGSGNVSSFPPMAVSDGAAPVPISIVSRDANGDGRVDHLVVTFSEPLGAYTAGNTPWSLVQQPPGVTLQSVSVAGTTATLSLNEGTGVDTVATGFQVSMASPSGIRDLSGNMAASFGPTGVIDGMGPVVTALSSTNVAGGTPGQIDTGDTLTLTFSEPLLPSSLPSNPTVTLMPGTGSTHDMLRVSRVALVDLGANDAYVDRFSVTFAASLTSSDGVVSIVVGTNAGGSGVVRRAGSATAMQVAPDSAVADMSGNPADGVVGIGPIMLF